MRTLIIDNYDSFTYNLFQQVGACDGNPLVLKNDSSIQNIKNVNPTHIIISPGPGTVENRSDFGICTEIIKTFEIPVLGVCLGHQGIAHAFGASIVKTAQIFHGKTSLINHNNSRLFKNVPSPFSAMRYHSLCIEESTLPESIVVTAREEEKNIIMAIQHCKKPLFGIQFHPESFATPAGNQIITNFLFQ